MNMKYQLYGDGIHDDTAGNKDFSIYGKPALKVMRKWCRG